VRFFNPPGRSEVFVQIDVLIDNDEITFDFSSLDRAGRKRLNQASNGRPFVALKGIAKLAWKDDSARSNCIKDHSKSSKRRNRWKQVEESASRMKNGELPEHGHVYVIDASPVQPQVTVIDGTRRMLAFLESGRTEMPIVAFLIGALDRTHSWSCDTDE
jgi:hypothetical protein